MGLDRKIHKHSSFKLIGSDKAFFSDKINLNKIFIFVAPLELPVGHYRFVEVGHGNNLQIFSTLMNFHNHFFK